MDNYTLWCFGIEIRFQRGCELVALRTAERTASIVPTVQCVTYIPVYMTKPRSDN